MNRKYQMCTRCVMDTTDPDITFDENGVCNHCKDFLKNKSYYDKIDKTRELKRIVKKIKEEGFNKPYDCIVSVSGGLDSTYLAYLAKKEGLKPLAVHVDNGWNSELAVKNIESIMRQLDIDLYTYVLDWQEFRDLQLSFLKASVPDAEIPTDHAIRAATVEVALRENIKYILHGRNYVTEGLLPRSWTYSAVDWKYIKSIHKSYGKLPLKKYPYLSLWRIFEAVVIHRIKHVGLLNYDVNYNKSTAIEILSKFGWRDYGGKHHESVYTRFFQAYILPKKFNIDKRKAHLSVLILNGEITRSEALEKLKKPIMDPLLLEEEKNYVIKKLGISKEEFEEIMSAPTKRYTDYPNNSWIFMFHRNNWLISGVKFLKKVKIIPEEFMERATKQ